MRRLTAPSLLLLATSVGCGSSPAQPGHDAATQPGNDASTQPGVDGSMSGTVGWRSFSVPFGPNGENHGYDRVTGILCSALDSCVVVTDDSGEDSPSGAVYTASDHAITGIIASGSAYEDTAMITGQIGFLGVERTRTGVVVRANVAGLSLSATGDFTNPSDWTAVFTGSRSDGTLGLNAQYGLQDGPDGRWVLVTELGHVYDATSAPGPTTVWNKLWSPEASPPVPEGFTDLFAADPTLCDSDVTTEVLPRETQSVYISPDLSLVMLPAGGINQDGSATPGVCYSTDGGHSFHHVPLPGVGDELGPLAVTCIDTSHCFAYNGLRTDDDSAYVYYTSNASVGAGMTWTRATLPGSLPTSNVELRNLFFAPDGVHGWMVGGIGGDPLLLHTDDAGHTWSDQSHGLGGMATARLHAGFALDAMHIWIGGENATLLSSDRGGQ